MAWLAGVCAPAPAVAGDWTIVPRFTAGATYTDNSRLSDTDRRSEYILTQTPGISLNGRGGRVQASVNYNLQNRVFVVDDQGSRLDHQLGANASAELWRDRLFFDARANVGRQNVNSFGRAAQSPLLDTGNTSTVINYSFGPRFRQRFSDIATLQVNYRYADTTASDGRTGFGGASQSFTAQVTSGQRTGRFGWSLNTGVRQNPGVAGGDDARFNDLSGQVSYQFTRQFRGFSNLGYALNDFQSNRNTRREGLTWSAGGTWTPSPRTSLTASYGDQPFGGTWSMNASHRAARWQLTSGFRETFATVDQILLERTQFLLVDENGLPVVDPLTNSLILIDLDLPRLTNDVLLQRRFDVGVNYALRRGSAGVTAYVDDRSYELAGDQEQVYGVRLNLSYALSPRLRPNVRAGWQYGSSDVTPDTEFSRYDVGTGLSYTFGRNLRGSLNYSFQTSEGGGRSPDFYENRVTGLLTLTF